MSDGVLRENKAAPVQVSYLGLTPSGTPGPALVARSRAAGSFPVHPSPAAWGRYAHHHFPLPDHTSYGSAPAN